MEGAVEEVVVVEREEVAEEAVEEEVDVEDDDDCDAAALDVCRVVVVDVGSLRTYHFRGSEFGFVLAVAMAEKCVLPRPSARPSNFSLQYFSWSQTAMWISRISSINSNIDKSSMHSERCLE